jgi:polyisoprenoid-binding protein YceI
MSTFQAETTGLVTGPPMPSESGDDSGPAGTAHRRSRYLVVPDASGVLVRARSTIGPIDFATMAISGYLEAAPVEGAFQPEPRPRSELDLDLRLLTSGNSVYDAELARRMDLDDYPLATMVLADIKRLSVSGRYSVHGDLTLHGVTRTLEGVVAVVFSEEGACSVSGEQVFDIRDFQIETPSLLMLRIFPDVRVTLTVTFRPDELHGRLG